jgi:phage recombination protein Bet
MTTALSTAAPAAIAVADPLDAERSALLRRTICNDLTPDEFELFAAVCRRTGLDPFAKQIYAMKRKNKNQKTGQWEEKLSIQTGIDGFRVIGERTGELDGQDGPYWCGPDGVWLDVWLKNEPPAAAKVVVFRKGCAHGYTGVAKFWEYAQAYGDKLSGLWGKMPATMIAKCAEALALRKAFPADLSGLYTSEEMEQAGDAGDEPKPKLAVAAHQTQRAAIEAPKDSDAPEPNPKKLAQRIADAKPESLGDPVKDPAALLALVYRKGGDYAKLVASINANFTTTYSPNHPWDKIDARHREAAVSLLNKAADRDSAAELSALLENLAARCKADPATVFQRYAASANLPESCIGVEDMDYEQVKAACAAFRGKLAELDRAKAQKGGAAK